MAISKSAFISVAVTAALLYFGVVPAGIAFLIGAIGVTVIYRGVKGCLNFVNVMALTGSGAVVLAFVYFQDWLLALVAGIIISVIVGLLYPG